MNGHWKGYAFARIKMLFCSFDVWTSIVEHHHVLTLLFPHYPFKSFQVFSASESITLTPQLSQVHGKDGLGKCVPHRKYRPLQKEKKVWSARDLNPYLPLRPASRLCNFQSQGCCRLHQRTTRKVNANVWLIYSFGRRTQADPGKQTGNWHLTNTVCKANAPLSSSPSCSSLKTMSLPVSESVPIES